MILTVEIRRHPRSRRLSAHIVQGAIAGVDLLSEDAFTQVTAAEAAMREFFRGCGIVLKVDVQSAPQIEVLAS